MQTTDERTSTNTSTSPAGQRPAGLLLEGLRKSYRSPGGAAVAAVRGVDVAIAPGETVALLGPNGAGKSTTIDMLLGLARPDAGTVSVFGLPPADAIRAGKVGALLQTGAVLRDLTVRELATMMASLYPTPLAVDEVLALAQVEELAGRRTEKLSGGETQRVRFALSLVSDPDLLVLDEPTVGLDVESRHAFWMTVRAFATRGKTILFATHYLDEADAYADRAVLIARGRIVADAPTTELKAMARSRTIRATLPDVPTEALERLPGVTRAERRGAAIVLTCADADTAIRALLAGYDAARDLEIAGAGLEEAFLHLTGGPDDEEDAS